MPSGRVMVGRQARWFYVTAGVLIAVAFVAAVMLRQSLPPKTVVMTTGTPGSAYEAFAQRYKALLARSHVELRLMSSAGAVENLERGGRLYGGIRDAVARADGVRQPTANRRGESESE